MKSVWIILGLTLLIFDLVFSSECDDYRSRVPFGDWTLGQIKQYLNNTTTSCGDASVGDEAASCVEVFNENIGRRTRPIKEILLENLSHLSECLKSYKTLVENCENDNAIAILQTLDMSIANNGQILNNLLSKLDKRPSKEENIDCDTEQLRRLFSTWGDCMYDAGIDDARQNLLLVITEFCRSMSGFNTCLRRLNQLSSELDCTSEIGTFLGAYYTSIQNLQSGDGDQGVLKRCFK